MYKYRILMYFQVLSMTKENSATTEENADFFLFLTLLFLAETAGR